MGQHTKYASFVFPLSNYKTVIECIKKGQVVKRCKNAQRKIDILKNRQTQARAAHYLTLWILYSYIIIFFHSLSFSLCLSLSLCLCCLKFTNLRASWMKWIRDKIIVVIFFPFFWVFIINSCVAFKLAHGSLRGEEYRNYNKRIHLPFLCCLLVEFWPFRGPIFMWIYEFIDWVFCSLSLSHLLLVGIRRL